MADLSNDNLSRVTKRVSRCAPKNDTPIWFLIACFVLDPTIPSGLRWRFRADMSPQWNSRWAGEPAGTMHVSRGKRKSWVIILLFEGRRRHLKAHRIIYALTHNHWPPDQVDHKDRSPSNKIENLRKATNAQNLQNISLPSNNASGFKGVSWFRQGGKWRADIRLNGKLIFLGLFVDILDAIAARQNAEIELHPFRVLPKLDQDIFCLPPDMPPEVVAEWKFDVRRYWRLPARIHFRA
jgi:HNH endonuclease